MMIARRFNIFFMFFIVLGGVMGIANTIILADSDSFINPNTTNNSANETNSWFDKLNQSSKEVDSTSTGFVDAISEALGIADYTLFRVAISLLKGFILPGLIIRDALLPLASFAPSGGVNVLATAITTICTIIQVGCNYIQVRYAYYLIRKV